MNINNHQHTERKDYELPKEDLTAVTFSEEQGIESLLEELSQDERERV